MKSSTPFFYIIVSHMSMASVIPPLMAYFSRRRSLIKFFHILGALIVFSALFDLIGLILMYTIKSTSVSNNIYTILEYCLLSFLYFECFDKRNHKFRLYALLAHFVFSALIFAFFIDNLFEYQWLIWCLCFFAIFIYSIFYSKKVLRDWKTISLSFIIINFTIMMYCGFNFLISIVMEPKFLNIDIETMRVLWMFTNVVNIAKNILFTIGIYYAGKEAESDTLE